MDLLDRYLDALRRNLPAARADDITSELRDELLDRIEAREAKLGRPVEKADMSRLLKDFGHPLVIATRYRKHQHLIGPDSYPFYLYGLRVIVVIALIVLLFAGIMPVLMGGDRPLDTFLSGLGRAYDAFILGFAWFTIVFAIGERIGSQGIRLNVWKPEGLPPVSSQRARGKWSSPIEVGFALLFLVWWAGRLPFPLMGVPGDVRVGPAPIWSTIYWPVLALAVAQLASNVLNWLQPQRVKLHGALALATTAIGICAISYIRGNGQWVTVSAAGRSAGELAEIARGLNFGVVAILSIALFASIIRAAILVYQLYLRRFLMGR